MIQHKPQIAHQIAQLITGSGGAATVLHEFRIYGFFNDDRSISKCLGQLFIKYPELIIQITDNSMMVDV
jgi:hypothetical protein